MRNQTNQAQSSKHMSLADISIKDRENSYFENQYSLDDMSSDGDSKMQINSEFN